MPKTQDFVDFRAATPETGQGAKENTGTAIGAVTGALIGSQFVLPVHFSFALPGAGVPSPLPLGLGVGFRHRSP